VAPQSNDALLTASRSKQKLTVPRRHHFIPAFYLSQWCDPAGKLVEYTKKHGKLISKPVGPDSTGFQFDLYAFPELSPDLSQFVEQKFFDYADRTASDALQLHLTGNGSGWNVERRSAWSRFVNALHLRHPDAMSELRVAAKAIWEGSGESSQREYEKIKQPRDPDTYEEYLERIDPLRPVKARAELIMKMFDNQIVEEHINNMRHAVVDVSPSRHKLLTSDRPVGLFGIKETNGMITLPISPTKLFVAVNDPRVLERIGRKRPAEIVSQVNTHLVARARRFVWSRDQFQTAFIEKHMSTSLEPTPLFPSLGKF
jgi:hypothetical protein